jgi:hypothetical protein
MLNLLVLLVYGQFIYMMDVRRTGTEGADKLDQKCDQHQVLELVALGSATRVN